MVNPFKQATMENYASQIATNKKKAIDLQLGRFLFSTDLSFNVVESEEENKSINIDIIFIVCNQNHPTVYLSSIYHM
jgi:hypothetical protein